ncbi:ATP-binding cassette domain-containing protein [Clostridia bacterium OttesenSCG-928-O13]|nr:ATP-binding cassette domain-containing protein [Clostridia bacterium OttesenSCG-928-O13]
MAGRPQAKATGELAVSVFSYTYKNAERPALEIESLVFPQKAVIAIVGKNGAGKSTFAKCLCGQEKKCHGEVHTTKGVLKNRQLLKRNCMVMQDVNHQLFTESVLDEVLLGMKEPSGEKQRVAIAGTLASGRNTILFYEPTSGLDLSHMREVAAVLQKLSAQGKTVFINTHGLELILACGTHALHLDDVKAVFACGYTPTFDDGRPCDTLLQDAL